MSASPVRASQTRRTTLIGGGFDFTYFVLPGVLAALVGLAVGLQPATSQTREGGGLGLWIVGVVLVDVAHVYASLYRTYLDPHARRLHGKRLLWAPLLCLWFGVLLHLGSPLLFWSVLAYVAIFHFIKQHVGFALLYVRAGQESAWDRRLAVAGVWAGTLGPVLYWHAHLPTRFAWFMQGDLISGAPAWWGAVALWGQLPIWVAFLGRRLWHARWGRLNPFLLALVVLPAANWHLGIVCFDDDRVFTITNVFFHGVPYLALVWVTGGRAQIRNRLPSLRGPATAIAFYVVLAGLAVFEEGLWDRLIWHEHEQLFGHGDLTLGRMAEAFVVAALTVPQATHYLLDRWIWKVGPKNPELATQLGFVRTASANPTLPADT